MEELMEMIGMAIFLGALLRYLSENVETIRLRFGDDAALSAADPGMSDS